VCSMTVNYTALTFKCSVNIEIRMNLCGVHCQGWTKKHECSLQCWLV
jgi:hypothetical protein